VASTATRMTCFVMLSISFQSYCFTQSAGLSANRTFSM